MPSPKVVTAFKYVMCLVSAAAAFVCPSGGSLSGTVALSQGQRLDWQQLTFQHVRVRNELKPERTA